MLILRAYEILTTLKRAVQIVWIIAVYYVVTFLGKSRLTRSLTPKKYKTNGSVISRSALIRITIERLGPTFVKFAQFLSERGDILPESLREEFKKLHSNVEPFNNDLAFQIIEEELRGSINDHFNWINPECIASASIGQVYLAELKNGEKVVVKLQRPGIEQMIKQDILLLNVILRKLSGDLAELNAVDVNDVLNEFGKNLLKELNYINEANNINRFTQILNDMPICKVPHVFNKYTTKKMLVIEFMEGIQLSDKSTLIENNNEPKIIARNLIEIFIHTVVKHGFFHADPHKGNIIVQNNNTIALIDFGSIGNIKPGQIELLVNLIMGITKQSPKAVAEALVNICNAPTYHEIEDLEFAIDNIFKTNSILNNNNNQMSHIISECSELLIENKLKLPPNMVLLFKALMTIEKNIKSLDPEIDIAAIFKPYAKEMILEKFSVKKIAEEGFYAVKKYFKVIKSLPNDVTELIDNLKNGKLVHDVRFSKDGKFNLVLKNFGNILLSVLLTGFILVTSGLLISSNNIVTFSKVLFVLGSINAIWLFFRIRNLINSQN